MHRKFDRLKVKWCGKFGQRRIRIKMENINFEGYYTQPQVLLIIVNNKYFKNDLKFVALRNLRIDCCFLKI